ncbi:MAG: CHASE2 domain-containing protein, partial [Cyanobacteria bacterium J06560_2]
RDEARGEILLNATDRLTIPQLKHALKKAIDRGLNTAIFNSCDGLGLAADLADLYIPQVLVMREPVPDRVAHAFLQGFLKSFSEGVAFYGAVREAREQLQGLESRFPCASWLPVIVQNLAETPPTWQTLCGESGSVRQDAVQQNSVQQNLVQQRLAGSALVDPAVVDFKARKLVTPRRLSLAGVASLSCAALVLFLRFVGLLEPVELKVYDLLLRSRPAEDVDSRLLIVTNTAKDIEERADSPEEQTLSDETLSELLAKLKPLNPQVIGLDIYRDFPADSSRLAQQIKETDDLITICKSQSDGFEVITPPPEVTDAARVGFTDFVADDWETPRETLRRHLVLMGASEASGIDDGSAVDVANCEVAASLSAAIAARFLSIAYNIPFTDDNALGESRLPYIRRENFGGYHNVDGQGDQLMLNYRIVREPAQRNCGEVYETPAVCISVGDLLERSPEKLRSLVENKIVLIGTTSVEHTGDLWNTPYYTDDASTVTPGVFLQAQMVSQLISAALGERSLIKTLALWQEIGWTVIWALAGGGIGLSVGRSRFCLRLLLAEGLLVLATWLWLAVGSVWVPLLPSAIALPAAALTSQLMGNVLNRRKRLPYDEL